MHSKKLKKDLAIVKIIMKKLSIIVPVYNAEPYLMRNMFTIIDQLTDLCELILINDGSTDKSGMICDQLASLSNNIIVLHKNNGGVSSARNLGIKAASGEYITFVDSDDYVENNYVSELIKLSSSGDDIIFFNAYFVDETNCKKIMKPWLSSLVGREDKTCAEELLLGCKSNEPWDKLFKLNLISEYNIIFPENTNLGEDLIFALNYLKHIDSVKVCDKPLYYHILNKSGLGSKKADITVLKYHDLMFSCIIETLQSLNVSPHIENLAYNMMLQILANTIGKLKKNGFTNAEICNAVSSFQWYSKIVSRKYFGFKSCLRRFLLSKRMYNSLMLIFKK